MTDISHVLHGYRDSLDLGSEGMKDKHTYKHMDAQKVWGWVDSAV